MRDAANITGLVRTFQGFYSSKEDNGIIDLEIKKSNNLDLNKIFRAGNHQSNFIYQDAIAESGNYEIISFRRKAVTTIFNPLNLIKLQEVLDISIRILWSYHYH